jgi:hypothetical protein
MSELKHLARGTSVCPVHKTVQLHFEQIHGMRVIREGRLHAYCPECKTDYTVQPTEGK